ncbi:MAG: tetratricopeptide repeat protein [Candidatus Lokiarchaeota archaeon]|nr:tetratricopeptide repeat protein [Candidatus Lokiarchaeota archaeon]
MESFKELFNPLERARVIEVLFGIITLIVIIAIVIVASVINGILDPFIIAIVFIIICGVGLSILIYREHKNKPTEKKARDLSNQGLYAKSIEYYQRLLAKQPINVSMWLELARVYEKKKMHSEALNAYNVILEIDPNNNEVKEHIISINNEKESEFIRSNLNKSIKVIQKNKKIVSNKTPHQMENYHISRISIESDDEYAPEEREELLKTELELELHVKEFICAVHKGPVSGLDVYICPKCAMVYCRACAQAIKTRGDYCWFCRANLEL